MYINIIFTMLLAFSLSSHAKLSEYYIFDDGAKVFWGEKSLDVSGLKVFLDSEMMLGGIGRCGDAAGILADGMKAIGSNREIYNLPFALDSLTAKDYDASEWIASDGKITEAIAIKGLITDAMEQKAVLINIAMAHNGHASLASLSIDSEKIELRFFDSVAGNNEDRYDVLRKKILSVLPKEHKIEEGHRVLHVLDQGDTFACGYYTVYTAMLLKNNKDFRNYSGDKIWFDEDDDAMIRATLAVSTMLDFGPANVKTDWLSLLSNYATQFFGKLGKRKMELKEDLVKRLGN